MGAAFLFLIVVIFLMTKWLKKLVKPIKEMEHAANRVSDGDYNIKLQVKSQDEIGSLAQAFNEMAQSIYLEEERKKNSSKM